MRRRLDLASSLLTRPRVLFLDEPTTGLDPRSRNQIWDAARDLVRDGTTLVLTTQYLEEADVLADSIAVVSHGRVIARGTGDELKDQVGGATVQVRLAPGASRERALAVLAAVRGQSPQLGPQEDLVALPADAGDVALVNEVAQALGDASVAVSELALRRPTLDDVFLQLTGERAEGDGDGADGEGPRSDGAGPVRPPHVASSNGAVARVAQPPRTGSDLAIEHHRTPITPAAVARALTDCLVVAGRNLRHFTRQPQLLLFSTVQPVMFVLLFAFVFGGAIGAALPPGVTYEDFLLPGIFIQSTAFRATQTASGLAEDLRRGVIDRFRSMPMARAAVLVGRSVADLVRTVFVVLLMVGVGYLIGFRFSEGPLNAVAAIAVVALFGFSLSWIFALIALTVKGQEAVQSAGFVAIFPLVFASSVFVPVETMPSWLEAFASVSPITLSADAARALAIGTGDLASLWQSLAWCAGLLAVFLPLSVWRYARMT
jgi:ABC transporter DrrB family efflux protein